MIASSGTNLRLYHYAGNNPITYTDPDGEFADTVWDAFSLATGVISLVSDIREGNVTAAAIDALGVVADAAAIAIPFVPGGAGNAIKALRTIETSANITSGILTSYEGIQSGNYLEAGSGILQTGSIAKQIKKTLQNDANVTKLLPSPKYFQDHHIIPAFRGKSKKYADFINSRGIDVDKFTVTIPGGKGGAHMNLIHGKGKWNQKWIEFIDNNPKATAKDIFQFAGKMMDEYGLNNLPIHQYHR